MKTTTRFICAALKRPATTAWCSSAPTARRGASASACACSPSRISTRPRRFIGRPDCRREWVDVPFQGRTLQVTDPSGVPLEFCATMTVMPRMVTAFRQFKGGCAHRLDHYQILVPDVQAQCEFYMAQGFRLSEYIVADHSEDLAGVFLQRKGNPHDIVFFSGAGPRLHHFAFTSIDAGDPDARLRRGGQSRVWPSRRARSRPARPRSRAIRLYSAIRTVIASNCSRRTTRSWISSANRSAGMRTVQLRKEIWGLPPQRSWVEEASEFAGLAVAAPKLKETPMTLERFLASRG